MRFYEPDEDHLKEWGEFVESRPPHVREVARRFFPWELYLLKTSNHRVELIGFSEEKDGKVTVMVAVLGRWNRVAFERRVFGIDPNDLEPCDLPGPDEKLGSALDEAGVPKEDQLAVVQDFFMKRGN